MCAFRLLAGVTVLLRSRKLARQFSFSRRIRIIVVRHETIMTFRFTVTLLLRGGKLASQRILLHSVGFIVGHRVAIVMLIAFGFTSRPLFRHPLGRQLNTIRCELTARWYADSVRARQLRANALFNLRARPFCRAKQRC